MLLYATTGCIDLFQIVIDLGFTEFLGAPEEINEFIDAGVGIGLAIYFQLRGVSLLKHPSRLFSLLGMEVLTDGTGGMASFWIADIWYMHKTVKQEDAEMAAQREQEAMLQGNVRQPLYQGGMRQPEAQTTEPEGPVNIDGIRPPGGGLIAN